MINADPLFYDTLFRQKKGKSGTYREVEPPVLDAPVADTHTHLQLQRDPALSIARCAVHNVSFLCTIVDIYEDGSTTFDELRSWLGSAMLGVRSLLHVCCGQPAAPLPRIRIAVGCHPHNAKYYDATLEESLRRRLADGRVCAVGEIGLDYHYDLSPRDVQRRVFRQQVCLAKECGLPVILHVREAHDEAFSIMQEEGWPEAGVLLHCFNLDWETLEPWVKAGCYVAFGGPLTFKKADEVRDAAARVPLEKLLTETDAPYMTPEPMRGMTCGPEHVIFTAARLAEVRGFAPGTAEHAEFLRQLAGNATGLLDRDVTPWQMHAAKEYGLPPIDPAFVKPGERFLNAKAMRADGSDAQE